MEEKVLVRSKRCSASNAVKGVLIFGGVLAFLLFIIVTAAAEAEGGLLAAFLCMGFFSLICGIIVLLTNGFELTVTDKRIHCTVAWYRSMRIKNLSLPLGAVSAVSLRRFKGISVSTASGRIHSAFIQNTDEIYNAITALMIAEQRKGIVFATNSGEASTASAFSETPVAASPSAVAASTNTPTTPSPQKDNLRKATQCVCGEMYYGMYCPSCGRKAGQPKRFACPKCRTIVKEGASSCKNCGQRFDW